MKSNEALITNIQRFSVQDGPGVRTTVFLKGCPLKCTWCANPETQNSYPEVAHLNSLCIKCGNCVQVCHLNAITMEGVNGTPEININRELCDNCGECAGACPSKALRLYGKYMSVAEVLEEVKKDMDFYLESGGGVTVSGGEPLMHADFVAELFSWCHKIGIHTTIDTCGYSRTDDLVKVFEHTNLFLFDLKFMDPSEHKQYTLQDNEIILRNFKRLIDTGISMVVRIPMIPGINDSEENLTNIAKFLYDQDKDIKVNLLPYHRYGIGKYGMLDRTYDLQDVKSPKGESLQNSLSIFKKAGMNAKIQY